MKVGRLITLYTAVMSLGKLVKRLNLLFRVVVVKSTSLRSRRLKGKVGGGGGGGGGELATQVRASVTVICESPFPKP